MNGARPAKDGVGMALELAEQEVVDTLASGLVSIVNDELGGSHGINMTDDEFYLFVQSLLGNNRRARALPAIAKPEFVRPGEEE